VAAQARVPGPTGLTPVPPFVGGKGATPRLQHPLRLPGHHRGMRPRVHLGPAGAFDLALAAVFGLLALAALLANGRRHGALTTMHTVASRIGWRETYETGLLLGLAGVALVAIVAAGLFLLVRRRA
jgi:hypothetical protein